MREEILRSQRAFPQNDKFIDDFILALVIGLTWSYWIEEKKCNDFVPTREEILRSQRAFPQNDKINIFLLSVCVVSKVNH